MFLDWRLALVALIPVRSSPSRSAVQPRRAAIYRLVRDRLGDINSRCRRADRMRVIQGSARRRRSRPLHRTSRAYYTERVRGHPQLATFFPASASWRPSGGAGARLRARMVVLGQISVRTLVAFMAYVVSFYDPSAASRR